MKTSINFAGIEMKNPVTIASGTLSDGREFEDFIDLKQLGAIITRGISLKPKAGNKPPRICETASGMLNSVGIQNSGIEYFAQVDLPNLKKYNTKIIVNACANTVEEYVELCKIINTLGVDGVELNLSCQYEKQRENQFETTYEGVKNITSQVRKVLDKPLIVKLTPNVTDITQLAKGAEDAGADGISAIDTLPGMKVDINKKSPILANNVGGLTGPAIKPIAVRCVYQIANSVKIPVIGSGGIMSGEDALEFMIAGATAVSIGAGNFIEPQVSIKTINGIENYMKNNNIEDLNEIIGSIKMN